MDDLHNYEPTTSDLKGFDWRIAGVICIMILSIVLGYHFGDMQAQHNTRNYTRWECIEYMPITVYDTDFNCVFNYTLELEYTMHHDTRLSIEVVSVEYIKDGD